MTPSKGCPGLPGRANQSKSSAVAAIMADPSQPNSTHMEDTGEEARINGETDIDLRIKVVCRRGRRGIELWLR